MSFPLIIMRILWMYLIVCEAALVNITIDDEVPETTGNATVNYFPPYYNVWNEGTPLNLCGLLSVICDRRNFNP